MAALTYHGPQELVFPHLTDPGGGGTLVLTPGRSYDFAAPLAGYEGPPGPAWWWQPPAPPVPPAVAAVAPRRLPAGVEPLAAEQAVPAGSGEKAEG